MAGLVIAREISFSYGGPDLLHEISFTVERGERIGLVGRNGAGKSTLMKLIDGILQPDNGTIERQQGLKVSRMEQEVPTRSDTRIYAEVAMGLGRTAASHILMPGEIDSFPLIADEQTGRLPADWELQHRVDEILQRVGLDPERRFESLSSGMKRRVLLAKALVNQPDVLLLDEPTNHLDIAAIEWIEQFLLKERPTLLFVTHDRVFLQSLATRIMEVDRARLFDWTCDYKTFLVRKEAALAAEASQDQLFDRKLAVEEVWVRTGVKARRTRNEGRVRALEEMRRKRSQRRQSTGQVRITQQSAERSGHALIKVSDVSFAYQDRVLFDRVNVDIERGDKVGIIGPNGSGKTTFLRLLLGELQPTDGTIRLGTNLQVTYFDQLRAQLDEERSVIDNIAGGNDTVLVNGRSRHVISYLQDFLFSGERSRTLVRYLSGGERNRLLLARMLTKPANLFVLDEPTNDLDEETLELLESLLVETPASIILVSHDRAFLDNVVTSTIVLEGGGQVGEYAGGYSDWLTQRANSNRSEVVPESSAGAMSSEVPIPSPVARLKVLSFKEQRELDELPARISQFEREQKQLHERLADAATYAAGGTVAKDLQTLLASVTSTLETAYARWELLEARRTGS